MIVRRSNNSNRRLRMAPRQRTHQLLEVKMRRDSLQQQRAKKIQTLLIKGGLAGLLLCATYFGGKVLLDKFFFKNPDYNVQHLEMALNEVMTPTELKNLTGLREGTNIFQVDLSAAEKTLSDLPEVKKAHVERLLPTTIQVSLERRVPIFRLVSSPEEPFVPGQSFVIDQTGVVMVPKKTEAALLELPVLQGLDLSHLAPGKSLQGNEKFSFALALWNILNNSKNSELLTMRSLDLSRDYDAVVIDENRAHFIFGEENLPAQMERLQKLFAHCQETGRQIESANLMLEHNTPVIFRSNSEAGARSKTALLMAKTGHSH